MNAAEAVPVRSVEELEQLWCSAIANERDQGWAACDVAAYLVGLAKTQRDRTAAVNRLAALGHCTSAYVRVRVQLSCGFGVESRHKDVSQALFRACIAAGKRLKLKPADVLEDALARGLHAAEVAQLGRPAKRLRVLSATCPACGLVARLRVTDGEPSAALPCPRCVVWAWSDGRDGKDAERLGVLA